MTDKSREVVSERELEIAFVGTNFGGANHRKLIEIGVLKTACGYCSGCALTQIMIELKLIGSNATFLKRGRNLMRAAFHEIMRNGG